MDDLIAALKQYASSQWSVGAPPYVCAGALSRIEADAARIRDLEALVSERDAKLASVKEDLRAFMGDAIKLQALLARMGGEHDRS